MNIRIFYCLVLVPLLFHSGHAQTITLEEFLKVVKESHPFFAKEAMSSEIERKAQERLLGAQDWVIRSSPYYTYQEPIARSSFDAERSYMAGAEIALEKPFWSTGGRLSLYWYPDFTDQDLTVEEIVISSSAGDTVISLGPSKFYQNKVFLTYSQPLMQNFGGKLDRLDYELYDYTVNLTEIQSLENQEGFLLNLGIRFLDWVLLSEQKQIATERLRLAEEEMQQTVRKRASNLVDQVDVLRAEDAVRIAKQNIVLIEARWKAKRAELAVLVQSRDFYDQNPEFDLYHQETFPSLETAISRLKRQSRILQALDIRQEQLSHQREGFVETARPQVLLNVGAGLQSGDAEFSDSAELDKPEVSVSLEFEYPLGNRTARADITKTDLQLQQLKEEIRNVELDLEARARNLLIQIKEMAKVLALNQEQIESAKAKTQEEIQLYNQGRGDLTFVIQSRDNEENAKLTYAQNGASYHKLILQYRNLVDELLPSDTTER